MAGLFEQIEDAGNVLLGEADARVAHAEDQSRVFHIRREPDAARRRRVLRGVVQQVDEDLRQANAVALEISFLFRKRDSQVMAPLDDHRSDRLQHVFHELAGFHTLPLELDLALRDPRDVEQIVHEPNEMVELTAHHRVQIRRFFFVRTASVEQVESVFQRRQRIAQLVRKHREKLVLTSVGFAGMSIEPRVLHGRVSQRTAEYGRGDADAKAHRHRNVRRRPAGEAAARVFEEPGSKDGAADGGQ
ncbi:MAG: hypothetical protein QM775_09720 [Pirellulales bacterium]